VDNPEKLVALSTRDENKQNKKKRNTICVGHYYTQANTNNLKKT